ncbi:hypothetical protein BY996DRAFT_6413320 [Phakopsora pachyrhizi]|nr:hypothetical protein BY996DRAFT_6413320 [Phakopsora pachyrhizi]
MYHLTFVLFSLFFLSANGASTSEPSGQTLDCSHYTGANTKEATCNEFPGRICHGGCTGAVVASNCTLNPGEEPKDQTCTIAFGKSSATISKCSVCVDPPTGSNQSPTTPAPAPGNNGSTSKEGQTLQCTHFTGANTQSATCNEVPGRVCNKGCTSSVVATKCTLNPGDQESQQNCTQAFGKSSAAISTCSGCTDQSSSGSSEYPGSSGTTKPPTDPTGGENKDQDKKAEATSLQFAMSSFCLALSLMIGVAVL